MGYIYQIRNRITGKSYIGETIKEPETRWKQHIACAKIGKGCPALRDAFNKYGIESFEFKILIICFDDDRFFYEKEYIKRYNTQAPNGYNILPGGIGGAGFKGKVHTKDVRKVISEKSKEMWKGFDEIQRENMKKTGREQLKKNIEEFKRSGKWNEMIEKSRIRMKELRAGTKLPEDTKNKIRDAVKRYYLENSDNKVSINIEKHRNAMCKAVGRPVG
jgi:group I intron endonuclease